MRGFGLYMCVSGPCVCPEGGEMVHACPHLHLCMHPWIKTGRGKASQAQGQQQQQQKKKEVSPEVSEHKRIYAYFRGLLKQWEKDLNARPDEAKRTLQVCVCDRYMRCLGQPVIVLFVRLWGAVEAVRELEYEAG